MNNAVAGYLGKVISAMSLQDDSLTIRFADGMGLNIYDEGQQCCECRYMDTDDDLSEVIGGVLFDVEIRDVDDYIEGEYGDVTDIQFLVVKTSKGEVVVSSYNEHNGYYGGFDIVFRELTVWN